MQILRSVSLGGRFSWGGRCFCCEAQGDPLSGWPALGLPLHSSSQKSSKRTSAEVESQLAGSGVTCLGHVGPPCPAPSPLPGGHSQHLAGLTVFSLQVCLLPDSLPGSRDLS